MQNSNKLPCIANPVDGVHGISTDQPSKSISSRGTVRLGDYVPKNVQELKNWVENRHREKEKYLAQEFNSEIFDKWMLEELGCTASDIEERGSYEYWRAYSFLKRMLGITSVWFSPEEYERRMDAICDYLEVDYPKRWRGED